MVPMWAPFYFYYRSGFVKSQVCFHDAPWAHVLQAPAVAGVQQSLNADSVLTERMRGLIRKISGECWLGEEPVYLCPLYWSFLALP